MSEQRIGRTFMLQAPGASVYVEVVVDITVRPIPIGDSTSMLATTETQARIAWEALKAAHDAALKCPIEWGALIRERGAK